MKEKRNIIFGQTQNLRFTVLLFVQLTKVFGLLLIRSSYKVKFSNLFLVILTTLKKWLNDQKYKKTKDRKQAMTALQGMAE